MNRAEPNRTEQNPTGTKQNPSARVKKRFEVDIRKSNSGLKTDDKLVNGQIPNFRVY